MNYLTNSGHLYAVSSANGCTITANGITLATAPAGEQIVFVATGSFVDVSDAAAIVTPII